MCTILLRLAPGTAEPVLLAANRYEFRVRPSDDPTRLAPGVFGGRDRKAGGTWLAVGRHGLAAITNVSGVPPRLDAPSRGRLPLDALAGRLPVDLRPWNAFNLLVVDAGGARVVSHDGRGMVTGPIVLGPGTHAITNEPFGADCARARRGAELLRTAAPSFALLADHGARDDGAARTTERVASAGLCHHGDEYGTVSATVVALDADLRVTRYLHAPGLPCRTASIDLTAVARAATGASEP
jgi:hypothetical protein